MSDAVWLVTVGLACGVAGTAVPESISRLPEPMGSVGRRPGLALRTGLACAVAGALLTHVLVPDWAGVLVVLPLVPPAVLLAVVDRRTHLLPSRVIWPMLGLAVGSVVLAGLLSRDGDAVLRAGIAGAGTFAFFHALWWIRPSGMGYGDVRLSAVLGVALGFLGWGELVVGIYAGFVGFALAATARAVVRRDRASLRVASPYGPYLLGGALVGVLVGGSLWSSLVSG